MNQLENNLSDIKIRHDGVVISIVKGLCYVLLFEFLLNYIAFVCLIANNLKDITDVSYIASSVASFVIVLTLVIISLIRKKPLIKEFHLKKITLPVAVVAFITGVSLNFTVIYIINFFPPDVIEKFSGPEESAPQNLIIYIIAAVIAAPVVEEVIFRNFALSRFRRGLPGWLAAIISAAVFGFVHLNLIQGIYAGLLGILLAVAFLRTESIFTSFLIHMGFNLVSIVSVIWVYEEMSESSRLVYDFALSLVVYSSLAVSVLGIVGLILLTRRKKSAAITPTPDDAAQITNQDGQV